MVEAQTPHASAHSPTLSTSPPTLKKALPHAQLIFHIILRPQQHPSAQAGSSNFLPISHQTMIRQLVVSKSDPRTLVHLSLRYHFSTPTHQLVLIELSVYRANGISHCHETSALRGLYTGIVGQGGAAEFIVLIST